MTVTKYSKINSLIIFLIAPVHWDLLNIGFKCRKATSFEAASKPLSVILSKSQSWKRYLSRDNLILNQSTQKLYTGIKLLHVVCGYIKCEKYFILTLRKFLTFSLFHFDLKIIAIFCLDFNFVVVEENICFSFFFMSDAG